MITLRNFNQYMVHITGIWILEIGRNQKKKKKKSKASRNPAKTRQKRVDF